MSRRAGPSLTKTEQLRRQKTAATLREFGQRQDTLAKHQPDPFKTRRRMVRPEPKKVDFTKPGMTKAMLARVKQAEKFKQEYERKQEAVTSDRQPRRTPAPIGDEQQAAHFLVIGIQMLLGFLIGKERTPGRERHTPRVSPAASQRTSPVRREFDAGPSRLATPRRVPVARRPKTPEQTLPRKTTELAKIMNADIVQAEPVGPGPITNVIIPPGTVDENRTTVVNISQPAIDETRGPSQVANRSIQVISETLDEQDAAESAAVQSRLSDLQQARRDFVIAVANVGGNAVNIEDEVAPEIFHETPYTTPPRHIVRVPDIESEFLQPEYGIDHPDVVAAREFLRKQRAKMEALEHHRRLEDEFAKIAAETAAEAAERVPEYHISIPVEREDEFYQYEPFDPDELERFFDVQAYPPRPHYGPPSGREHLPPDLWELEDPWYRPPPEPDVPDLIEFDTSDLIQFD
ncbi:uncharacterized protein LOC143428217 [Xylocopa sonorina]|uniref:uncharacterized protein LOC143428217 n=1 Tax=Xylocopa sonorina TaxID=1818115 RepID=UPI00403B1F91